MGLIEWLLDVLVGPQCPACGERTQARRLRAHYYVNHGRPL